MNLFGIFLLFIWHLVEGQELCTKDPERQVFYAEYFYIQNCENVDLYFGDNQTILANVKVLHGNDNNITELRDFAFENATNLSDVNFSRNKIEEIAYDAFYGLSSLKILGLDSNRISNLETGIFSALSSLEAIYLQKNELRTLKNGIFEGVDNLKEIDLSENKISSIGLNVFMSLNQLTNLDLQKNACVDKAMYIYVQEKTDNIKRTKRIFDYTTCLETTVEQVDKDFKMLVKEINTLKEARCTRSTNKGKLYANYNLRYVNATCSKYLTEIENNLKVCSEKITNFEKEKETLNQNLTSCQEDKKFIAKVSTQCLESKEKIVADDKNVQQHQQQNDQSDADSSKVNWLLVILDVVTIFNFL